MYVCLYVCVCVVCTYVLQGCVEAHLVNMLRSKKLDSNTNRFLLLLLLLPSLPPAAPAPAPVPLAPVLAPVPAVEPDLLLLVLEEEDEEEASVPPIVAAVVDEVDIVAVVVRLPASDSPSLPPRVFVVIFAFVVSTFTHEGGTECSASVALTRERTVSRVT